MDTINRASGWNAWRTLSLMELAAKHSGTAWVSRDMAKDMAELFTTSTLSDTSAHISAEIPDVVKRFWDSVRDRLTQQPERVKLALEFPAAVSSWAAAVLADPGSWLTWPILGTGAAGLLVSVGVASYWRYGHKSCPSDTLLSAQNRALDSEQITAGTPTKAHRKRKLEDITETTPRKRSRRSPSKPSSTETSTPNTDSTVVNTTSGSRRKKSEKASQLVPRKRGKKAAASPPVSSPFYARLVQQIANFSAVYKDAGIAAMAGIKTFLNLSPSTNTQLVFGDRRSSGSSVEHV